MSEATVTVIASIILALKTTKITPKKTKEDKRVAERTTKTTTMVTAVARRDNGKVECQLNPTVERWEKQGKARLYTSIPKCFFFQDGLQR